MRSHVKLMGLAACIGVVMSGSVVVAGLDVGKTTAGASTMYTVKKGDSLIKIARSQLGADSQWKEIAKLNGINKPFMIREGMEIKLCAGVVCSTDPTAAATSIPTAATSPTAAASIPSAATSPTTYQAPHAPLKEDEGPIATIAPTTYQIPPAPMVDAVGSNKAIHATTYQQAPTVLKANDKPLDNVIVGRTQTPAPRKAQMRGNNYF